MNRILSLQRMRIADSSIALWGAKSDGSCNHHSCSYVCN